MFFLLFLCLSLCSPLYIIISDIGTVGKESERATKGRPYNSQFTILNSQLAYRPKAFSTTLSTVKPNFSNNSSPGAEAPKPSIEIISPSSLYIYANLGRMLLLLLIFSDILGSTLSLYSSDCSSNNSQEGILTTLELMPFSFNISAAS